MDLITLNLKLAFREPGCPVCRLRQQQEQRYLFNLLYENVNDGTTRLRLVRGLGLCPDHAWRLQATEPQHWSDGLGTGIIYEDLTGRLLGSLSAYLAQDRSPQEGLARLMERLREWLKPRGRMGRWLAQYLPAPAPATSLLARLSPTASCRACEMIGDREETYLIWLARQSGDPEFRGWYSASDGLCLPHLRRALTYAEDEETVRFLAQVAADKLKPLLADLGEYLRKHSWHNRDEPKYPWEQASWIRSVAFFAGEAREEEGGNTYQVRRQALGDYRRRPDRVPGEEER